MAMGAPTVVEGAPRVAFGYGLFSVFGLRADGDAKWQNGVVWESLTCGAASGIGDPDCTPGATETTATGLPKTFADGVPVGEASQFSVYGSFKCSPVGRGLEAAQERARLHLLAREEARVERALWTGDLGNVPNLQDGATELIGPVTTSVHALSLLEGFIAENYGSLGVIHVSRHAGPSLAQNGQIDTSGSVARTILGTPVVFGAGYPISGPEGVAAAANSAWAFASPALFGYHSDVFYPSARTGDLLDRDVNDLYAIAERSYLLGFDDCGVGAVEFSLGCC